MYPALPAELQATGGENNTHLPETQGTSETGAVVTGAVSGVAVSLAAATLGSGLG